MASLTVIPHKIYITDDMLKLVLKMTSIFHTYLISKELKPGNLILKVLSQFS
jgi:hypothetical protein